MYVASKKSFLHDTNSIGDKMVTVFTMPKYFTRKSKEKAISEVGYEMFVVISLQHRVNPSA